MCNVLHFSTTSDEDFGLLPKDNFIIEQADNAGDAAHLEHLEYPNKWRIACRYGGCSCHFRHFGVFVEDEVTGALIGAEEAAFLAPDDDPHNQDDSEVIEDTGLLFDLFSRIVENRSIWMSSIHGTVTTSIKLERSKSRLDLYREVHFDSSKRVALL